MGDCGLLGNQHAGAGGNAKTCQLAEIDRRFAHNFRVDGAVRPQQQGGHFGSLAFVHEVGALSVQFTMNVVVNTAFDDDRLFGGTDHTIIEGFAGDDVFHRLRNIGAAFDEGRTVSRATADGRSAGSIGRTHHAFTTGCQDQ
ncbi:hypothetical protein D3C84_475120 [compost metagenome]